ncbi:hypothetical protein WJX84_007048 [Apatococcus fuscideae]|uniref:Aldehyde oxidase/xanthine dehydrogenase second molybdopterin binding domain-containing protein n=1 Tax=Apatococcus fuscideae TaxID=2026836 RepID=A0AAW1T6I1_9CHLO
MGLDPILVRERNFLQPPPPGPSKGLAPAEPSTGDHGSQDQKQEPGFLATPQSWVMKDSFGSSFLAKEYTQLRCWYGLKESCSFLERQSKVQEFNKSNIWRKRGIAMTNCRFDGSVQSKTALVTIYGDGSVMLSHGGLEMGQGLSTKVLQVAAYELGKLLPDHQKPLPLSLFQANDVTSDSQPNNGTTAGSTGSESTCEAILRACAQLRASLAKHVQERGTAEETWKTAVSGLKSSNEAPLAAIGFSDAKTNVQGSAERVPMKYNVFGAACSEVEVNLLTGEKTLLRSDILYDCGRSLNPAIDVGQVEGAFVMGIGVLATEEVEYDSQTGKLLQDSTWNYKIPSATCVPQQLNVAFLENSPNPLGVLSSKCVGEPPLMLSASCLSAFGMAVQAGRQQLASLDPDYVVSQPPAAAALDGATAEARLSSELPAAEPLRIRYVEARTGVTLPAFASIEAPMTTARMKASLGAFRIANILAQVSGKGFASSLENESSYELL